MKIVHNVATGFVGGAVAERLSRPGHQVVGSARSVEAASKLQAKGMTAHQRVAEPEMLIDPATPADAAVRAAFDVGRSNFAAVRR
jgi:uncharacterized protein YbjT (DUF2867 family)